MAAEDGDSEGDAAEDGDDPVAGGSRFRFDDRLGTPEDLALLRQVRRRAAGARGAL